MGPRAVAGVLANYDFRVPMTSYLTCTALHKASTDALINHVRSSAIAIETPLFVRQQMARFTLFLTVFLSCCGQLFGQR